MELMRQGNLEGARRVMNEGVEAFMQFEEDHLGVIVDVE